MSKRLFVLFFLLPSLLTACVTTSTSTPTPAPALTLLPQKMVTIENAGLVCFKEYDAVTKKLSGTFRPKGCFSSKLYTST
jgi:hypothetical protein